MPDCPSTTSPIIVARGLTRVYPRGEAGVVGLNNVDLTVPTGEFVVLKGNSGSGKSTLLALLAGLDRPTSGTVTVAGHDLATASESSLVAYRRDVIGMVFQAFNLLPTLTVLENTRLPGLLSGRAFRTVDARARELLDWLGLASRLDHFPSQLSGGEMQRTAIARALVNDPPVILADEPTGNLDSRNGEAVVRLLSELNRTSGRTLVVATHSSLADPFATIRVDLKDGEVANLQCGA